MASSFTLKLDPIEAPGMEAFFRDQGFEIQTAPYAFFQARVADCSATFYTSGKLLVQGKGADGWREQLAERLPDARPYHRALSQHPRPAPAVWVGTDEAGKGDYFGPLVVAGVALQREHVPILATLGVDDSKALADSKLPELEQAILALGASEVLVMSPGKYNELYPRMGNLNRLLAWAHGRVIETLLEKAPTADWVLVDRFADESVLRRGLGERGRAVRFSARPKAEEDPAVAAASILARSAYLRGLHHLSRRAEVKLHPGAGAPTLASAREFVARHGKEALVHVAKVHFATTEQI